MVGFGEVRLVLAAGRVGERSTPRRVGESCEGATGAGCGLGVWPIGLAGQSSGSSSGRAEQRWRCDRTASSGYRYRASDVVREEEEEERQHWVVVVLVVEEGTATTTTATTIKATIAG